MILVDTNVVFWLAQAPGSLTETATAAISEARHHDGVAVSGKTLWELAMMVSRGRVVVRTSMQEFLREVERYFIVMPITGPIAERSVGFSENYPKDPSDRLIGATAIVHELKLVTADDAIRKSGEVSCIW